MATPEALAYYRKLINFARKAKFAGVPIAVLGVLLGFQFDGSARIVVWIVSGLLAAWFTVQYAYIQRRYQRRVDTIEQAQS